MQNLNSQPFACLPSSNYWRYILDDSALIPPIILPDFNSSQPHLKKNQEGKYQITEKRVLEKKKLMRRGCDKPIKHDLLIHFIQLQLIIKILIFNSTKSSIVIMAPIIKVN
jgi:hypothetical protein